MGKALSVKEIYSLVDEIAASVHRFPVALIGVTRLKSHDNYTYMHSLAVCGMMVALTSSLGVQRDAIRTAGLAGLMHDVGKATVDGDILNKPGPLTDLEFERMKRHSEAGATIIIEAGGATLVADVALHHHERVDGKGYPHGLSDDAISLLARMGAVCDVYDAVTSERVYSERGIRHEPSTRW
ncbi:HDIG domain protein [Candidatus Burkholderia humilis]|nr:HDIG domain protein [Candidatus Burkholderia humilis]